MPSVVDLVDLHKTFPGVAALSGVTLSLRVGQIHALVGENGAGKSTLLNILAGSLLPDIGDVRLDGRTVRFDNALDARRAGIVMVHQEVDLFAELSIAENIAWLTDFPTAALGGIAWRELHRRASAALEAVGESMAPETLARHLSPAQRQMVEIAAAVSRKARVLILDEPTSSLSASETETLFRHLRRIREQGTAVVYVSHRLDEIFALAHEVTVLRDGRRVWHGKITATSPSDLIQKMVGRDTLSPEPQPQTTAGTIRLRCENVSASDGSCCDISLEASSREVLGLYGLIGAGRSEWAQVLLGLRVGVGHTWVDGASVRMTSPALLARRGVIYVPEDRLRQGLCRSLTVRANAALASLRQLAIAFFLPAWRETRLARRVVQRLDVRVSSIEQPVGTLSGGNQQKVVLGRWLERDPAVLILDEPTRGIDVGAKEEIHRAIRRLANDGKAVILISSDLPEVLAHSDRIGVFRQGRLAGVFPRGASAEDVAAAALPVESRSVASDNGESARRLPREIALIAIIAILIGLIEVRGGGFLTAARLGNLLSDSVLLGFVASGAALVIVAGGIDISLGSLMALSAAVAGRLWEQGTPWPAVLLVALIVGTGGGMLNATLTHAGRVHPIVVTLGTMSIFRGLMRWHMGQDIQIPGAARNVLFGENVAAPPVVWFGLLVFGGLTFFLQRTQAGRSLFAVGGNASAARRVGLSPPRVWLKAFAIQGGLAGLAGVLFLARSGSLQTTSYDDKTLQAVSAAVVGGVAITGGRGSISGVLLGCVLLTLLSMACQFLRISMDWHQAVVGAVMVVAVSADALWRRRS